MPPSSRNWTQHDERLLCRLHKLNPAARLSDLTGSFNQTADTQRSAPAISGKLIAIGLRGLTKATSKGKGASGKLLGGQMQLTGIGGLLAMAGGRSGGAGPAIALGQGREHADQARPEAAVPLTKRGQLPRTKSAQAKNFAEGEALLELMAKTKRSVAGPNAAKVEVIRVNALTRVSPVLPV